MSYEDQPIYVGPDIRAESNTHGTLKVVLKEAFKEAITELAKDDEFNKSFWKAGYNELANHTGNTAKQWIGGRILTLIAITVFGLCIKYLVQSGAIK